MLAKKPEQDTAPERPGLMLRRERGARGMERAWAWSEGSQDKAERGRSHVPWAQAGMKSIA